LYPNFGRKAPPDEVAPPLHQPSMRRGARKNRRLPCPDDRLDRPALSGRSRTAQLVHHRPLAPLRRRVEAGGRRLCAAVDRHHDRVARRRIAAPEDQQVAVARHALVRAVRQRRVGAADGDQPLVPGAQPFVARQAGAGLDLAVSPRHVAPVVRPVAARPPHLFAVIDHRQPARRQLQDGRQPEEHLVSLELKERAGHVVRREVRRQQVAGADLVTRLEIAVERDRPSAPLQEAEDVALEREVETGVHLVAGKPGVERLRVAAPHLAN